MNEVSPHKLTVFKGLALGAFVAFTLYRLGTDVPGAFVETNELKGLADAMLAL